MLEQENVGQVRLLTLSQPPVNAMSTELCGALQQAFQEADASAEVSAVVVTGAGPAFSAGADLRDFLAGGPAYAEAFFPALAGCLRAVFVCSKPVVAAVNGHALAGGCVLAAAADLVLMADEAGRIGLPELEVGVAFPRSALEVMSWRLGPVAARRLIREGKGLPASAALSVGLVDEVVELDTIVSTAIERAEHQLRTFPADTLAETKLQLRIEHIARLESLREQDEKALEIWRRRSQDGWTQAYLDRVTRKS